MTSEYERRAARAAVDAVEQRWARDQENKRRQLFHERLVSLLASLGLLLAAGAVVVGYLIWNQNGDFSVILDWGEKIRQVMSVADERADRRLVNYANAIDRLLSAPVKLSQDIPLELKPKNAASGLPYLVLCRAQEGRLAVFKMIADGQGNLRIWQLSPVANSFEVSLKEFQRFHGKTPYLVVVRDSAYLYGSSDLADAESLRAAVRDFSKK